MAASLVGVVVTLAIVVTWLTLGTRPMALPTASQVGSATESPAPRQTSSEPTGTASSSPLPNATATGQTDHPNRTGGPLSPTEPVTGPPSTTPTKIPSSAPAGLITLNDTSFTAPEGWAIYGDELIETDRRLVRLTSTETNIRFQVVTLKSAEADLSAACRALVASQMAQFTNVTEQPAAPVGVNASKGAAATCGFRGIRSSDSVANAVTFTLLRRATDSHVLMLRSTVPDGIPAGSAAPGQLAAMQCNAGGSFGVTLPLC